MHTLAKVKRRQKEAKEWLWTGAQKVKNPFLKPLVRALRILYLIGKDLREGQLNLRAMSLVYTSIISLVPLLALSFSVLKGFGAHNQIRPMIEGMVAPIGDDSQQIADNIIGFIDNIQVGVLGAVGLALLIYSVVAMMQKIERSFNYIWHVKQERSFGQRFNDYLSMLLVGPLLLFLSAGITGGAKMDSVNNALHSLPGGDYMVALIAMIIPYFIMALGFTFIYVQMPNTKVNLGPAFIGGLTTAIVWKSLGFLFTMIVAGGGTKTAIYATFASIIILMIWLYIAWLILLVGASIAFYAQHPFSTPFIRHHEVRLSPRLKETLGLDMMLRIARAFKQGKVGPSTTDLVRDTGMPHEVVRQLAQALEHYGLIHFTNDKPHVRHIPARSLEHVGVVEVLDALRADGDMDDTHEHRLPATAKTLKIGRSALEKSYAKQSLDDII